MKITANIDKGRVDVVLKQLNRRSKQMRPALEAIGEDLKLFVRDSIEQQRDPVTGKRWVKNKPISSLSRPGGAGKSLFDTGRLLQSFAAFKPRITNTSVMIGSNVKYARIHQRGGTIKAKGGGVLTIPLSREAKRAGNARRFIDQKAKKGERPFFFKSKKGNLLLGYMKGKKGERSSIKTKKPLKANPGKMVLAFYCPKQVKIPQRRYLGLGPSHKEKILGRLVEYVGEGLKAK